MAIMYFNRRQDMRRAIAVAVVMLIVVSCSRGNGSGTAVGGSAQAALTDGNSYVSISPKELDFNIDAKTVKVGDRYLVEGRVLAMTGNNLTLADLGLMNDIELKSFAEYKYNDRVRVYLYLESFNSLRRPHFIAERIDKLR